MNDNTVVILVLYVCFAAIFGGISLVLMSCALDISARYPSNKAEKDARTAARSFFLCWAWPVLLLVLIAMWLRSVYRIATMHIDHPPMVNETGSAPDEQEEKSS